MGGVSGIFDGQLVGGCLGSNHRQIFTALDITNCECLLLANCDFFSSQVPGVEADDVIGTLAVRSIDEGHKVHILVSGKN